MANQFDALFEPVRIGKMKLKNRICMAPMFTKYATESGEVTDKLIEYLVRRAKGGVSLIVLENTCIEWEYGRVDGNPVTIHDDRFRPRLHDLVKAVHRHGAKIVTEIHHVGRQTFSSNIGGKQPLAPSAVCSRVGGDMPRAMNEAEIEKAIQDYADAARRTKECGFDGVELHGAHGYLISEFISPLTNQRTDKWGGSFENRCRFAVEIVRRVRREVGPDYPLLFRFSAEECVPGGLTLAEGVQYAKVLEKEGVDCFDVSCGSYETTKHFPMQGDRLNQLVYLAAAVKAEVSVPVIAVGSLGWDPAIALEVIKKGEADLVHFGRELLADPDLPQKIKANKLNEIRRCLRCNECTGSLDKGHFLACVVNAECGYEYKDVVRPALQPHRIVVVGAGPAGLEYAITAAKRGYRVTVLEKEDKIGGLAHVAEMAAYKQPEVSYMLRYYETMLKKLGVDLHLGVEASPDKIMEFQPHHVVLAMGAQPVGIDAPGAEYSHNAVLQMKNGAEGLGASVCVIGGSGVGLDVAMYLKDKGKNVTVLVRGELLGKDLSHMMRTHLTDLLAQKGITIKTGHRPVKITEKGVIVEHKGEEFTVECDNVLCAVGFKRVDISSLEQELSEKGVPVTILGADLQGAGHFMDAIHAGFWAAVDL